MNSIERTEGAPITVSSCEHAPYNDGVMNAKTWQFVREHREENVRELALRAGRDGELDVPLALDQIAGWQTARTKLPRWAECEDIIYPPHISMEQCSSQFTAEYKAQVAKRLIAQTRCASLVDLTGGFGVDYSYMASAFAHATYVERQAHLCKLAEHNMAALGLHQVTIVNDTAEQYLATMPEATLIFLDPARRDEQGRRTYAISDCTPNALCLLEQLLAKAPHVMVKLSPMLDWHQAVADFDGHVSEVHILSVSDECKELLLVLGRQHCPSPHVWCVNGEQILDFDANSAFVSLPKQNTQNDSLHICTPFDERPPSYLYEPNASVMKAGCFALLEERFSICQVSANSHLFVSRNSVPDFPGRAFTIEGVTTMNKHNLRQTLGDLTQANITVRNFPMSVNALRAKLKLKDGGDTYLFATTDSRGNHLIIRAHK